MEKENLEVLLEDISSRFDWFLKGTRYWVAKLVKSDARPMNALIWLI